MLKKVLERYSPDFWPLQKISSFWREDIYSASDYRRMQELMGFSQSQCKTLEMWAQLVNREPLSLINKWRPSKLLEVEVGMQFHMAACHRHHWHPGASFIICVCLSPLLLRSESSRSYWAGPAQRVRDIKDIFSVAFRWFSASCH